MRLGQYHTNHSAVISIVTGLIKLTSVSSIYYLSKVYQQHVELRNKQIHNYKTFIGPVRNSTICRSLGCRRVFGRRGLIFCTEGCCDGPDSSCSCKKQGDAAPPFMQRDIDDEHDASVVLQRVVGDPPLNVTYRRWQWDEESQFEMVVTPPSPSLLEEEGRKSV